MDALFFVGQVVWVAMLACGAYVSFSFYELADEEHAKTARRTPSKAGSAAQAPAGMNLEATH